MYLVSAMLHINIYALLNRHTLLSTRVRVFVFSLIQTFTSIGIKHTKASNDPTVCYRSTVIFHINFVGIKN